MNEKQERQEQTKRINGKQKERAGGVKVEGERGASICVFPLLSSPNTTAVTFPTDFPLMPICPPKI